MDDSSVIDLTAHEENREAFSRRELDENLGVFGVELSADIVDLQSCSSDEDVDEAARQFEEAPRLPEQPRQSHPKRVKVASRNQQQRIQELEKSRLAKESSRLPVPQLLPSGRGKRQRYHADVAINATDKAMGCVKDPDSPRVLGAELSADVVDLQSPSSEEDGDEEPISRQFKEPPRLPGQPRQNHPNRVKEASRSHQQRIRELENSRLAHSSSRKYIRENQSSGRSKDQLDAALHTRARQPPIPSNEQESRPRPPEHTWKHFSNRGNEPAAGRQRWMPRWENPAMFVNDVSRNPAPGNQPGESGQNPLPHFNHRERQNDGSIVPHQGAEPPSQPAPNHRRKRRKRKRKSSNDERTSFEHIQGTASVSSESRRHGGTDSFYQGARQVVRLQQNDTYESNVTASSESRRPWGTGAVFQGAWQSIQQQQNQPYLARVVNSFESGRQWGTDPLYQGAGESPKPQQSQAYRGNFSISLGRRKQLETDLPHRGARKSFPSQQNGNHRGDLSISSESRRQALPDSVYRGRGGRQCSQLHRNAAESRRQWETDSRNSGARQPYQPQPDDGSPRKRQRDDFRDFRARDEIHRGLVAISSESHNHEIPEFNRCKRGRNDTTSRDIQRQGPRTEPCPNNVEVEAPEGAAQPAGIARKRNELVARPSNVTTTVYIAATVTSTGTQPEKDWPDGIRTISAGTLTVANEEDYGDPNFALPESQSVSVSGLDASQTTFQPQHVQDESMSSEKTTLDISTTLTGTTSRADVGAENKPETIPTTHASPGTPSEKDWSEWVREDAGTSINEGSQAVTSEKDIRGSPAATLTKSSSTGSHDASQTTIQLQHVQDGSMSSEKVSVEITTSSGTTSRTDRDGEGKPETTPVANGSPGERSEKGWSERIREDTDTAASEGSQAVISERDMGGSPVAALTKLSSTGSHDASQTTIKLEESMPSEKAAVDKKSKSTRTTSRIDHDGEQKPETIWAEDAHAPTATRSGKDEAGGMRKETDTVVDTGSQSVTSERESAGSSSVCKSTSGGRHDEGQATSKLEDVRDDNVLLRKAAVDITSTSAGTRSRTDRDSEKEHPKHPDNTATKSQTISDAKGNNYTYIPDARKKTVKPDTVDEVPKVLEKAALGQAPPIRCNFIIIEDSSDEEDDRKPTAAGTPRTTQHPYASRLSTTTRPDGRKPSTTKKVSREPISQFDFEKNYDYNMSQEAAMAMQERMLEEAAARIRTQFSSHSAVNPTAATGFQQPVFDIHKQYPNHWRWKDPYSCLGLPPNSPVYLVKSQYRRLARIYHPDKSKVPDTATKFHAIASAYRKLCGSHT